MRALLAALCAVLILALSGPVGGSPLLADLAQPFVGEAASEVAGPSLDLEPEDDADGASTDQANVLAWLTQDRRAAAARRSRPLRGPSARGPPTHRR